MNALFHPFSPSDHETFAGAEDFDGGAIPMIADMTVDGLPAIAVVDRNGVTILVSDEYESFMIASFTAKGPAAIRALAAGIPRKADTGGLNDLGFEEQRYS